MSKSSQFSQQNAINNFYNNILNEWSELANTPKHECIIRFMLTMENSCPMYGVHYFPITNKSARKEKVSELNCKDIKNYLGISLNGIAEYSNSDLSLPLREYAWKELESLYHKDNKFTIETIQAKMLENYEALISQDRGHRQSVSSSNSNGTNESYSETNSYNDLNNVNPDKGLRFIWYGPKEIIFNIWNMAIHQHKFSMDKYPEGSSPLNLNISNIVNELSVFYQNSPNNLIRSISKDLDKVDNENNKFYNQSSPKNQNLLLIRENQAHNPQDIPKLVSANTPERMKENNYVNHNALSRQRSHDLTSNNHQNGKMIEKNTRRASKSLHTSPISLVSSEFTKPSSTLISDPKLCNIQLNNLLQMRQHHLESQYIELADLIKRLCVFQQAVSNILPPEIHRFSTTTFQSNSHLGSPGHHTADQNLISSQPSISYNSGIDELRRKISSFESLHCLPDSMSFKESITKNSYTYNSDSGKIISEQVQKAQQKDHSSNNNSTSSLIKLANLGRNLNNSSNSQSRSTSSSTLGGQNNSSSLSDTFLGNSTMLEDQSRSEIDNYKKLKKLKKHESTSKNNKNVHQGQAASKLNIQNLKKIVMSIDIRHEGDRGRGDILGKAKQEENNANFAILNLLQIIKDNQENKNPLGDVNDNKNFVEGIEKRMLQLDPETALPGRPNNVVPDHHRDSTLPLVKATVNSSSRNFQNLVQKPENHVTTIEKMFKQDVNISHTNIISNNNKKKYANDDLSDTRYVEIQTGGFLPPHRNSGGNRPMPRGQYSHEKMDQKVQPKAAKAVAVGKKATIFKTPSYNNENSGTKNNGTSEASGPISIPSNGRDLLDPKTVRTQSAHESKNQSLQIDEDQMYNLMISKDKSTGKLLKSSKNMATLLNNDKLFDDSYFDNSFNGNYNKSGTPNSPLSLDQIHRIANMRIQQGQQTQSYLASTGHPNPANEEDDHESSDGNSNDTVAIWDRHEKETQLENHHHNTLVRKKSQTLLAPQRISSMQNQNNQSEILRNSTIHYQNYQAQNNPHYFSNLHNNNYHHHHQNSTNYPPNSTTARTKSWNTNNNNNHTIKHFNNNNNQVSHNHNNKNITAVVKHNSKGSVTYLTEQNINDNLRDKSRGNTNVNVQQLRQNFMQRPISKSTPVETIRLDRNTDRNDVVGNDNTGTLV